MESIANVASARWHQSSRGSQIVIAPRGPLLSILNKIFGLALNLFFIRLFSAAMFVISLWLCPVQIFANLGVYLALISVTALAVFGRYELLVVAAHDERKCADAIHLCIIIGACIVVTTLLIAIALRELFIAHVTIFFAAALFARAWLRLGLTLATRYGRYNRAVKAMLPHAIIQPLILVSLIYNGYNPFLAFVISDVVGHLIAASCVCISEWRAFRFFFLQQVRYHRIGKLAAGNLGLPTLNLTAAASAFLFATTPLFFLPTLPNGILAGTLALLFRMLDVPTALTTASIGPILMKEVADRNRDGTRWKSRSTFLLPATIATIVFGLISLAGLTLNHLEFAPSWHMALTILPAVALFQAGIAATSPLIDIATLAGRQKGLLSVNVIAVALAATALVIWSHNPIHAIMLAGSIGFARVIAMSILLVGSGEPGRSGRAAVAWSTLPKITRSDTRSAAA
jgi:hypothetical protein